ncbi:MAG: hypothetical protein QXD43_02035 [Candidatus Aenigmatarchaeota archaeon]
MEDDIKSEAKKIFLRLFGPEIAKQVDNFEDPNKYPKEFLNDCTYFLTKLIGEESAKENLMPLYKKIAKKH